MEASKQCHRVIVIFLFFSVLNIQKLTNNILIAVLQVLVTNDEYSVCPTFGLVCDVISWIFVHLESNI